MGGGRLTTGGDVLTMTNQAALDLLSALVLEDGRLWGEAAAEWQWDAARTMLDPDAPPYRWESRPRGGSKTTDAAALVLALMMTSLPAGSRSYCYAASSDQARLVVDALAGFVARTPEMRGHVEVGQYRATTPSGSVLEVLSADAATSWGIRPALVIADEITNWPGTSNARALWQSTFSSLGKVPGARLLCISTSGDPGHWTRKIYDVARKSPLWTVQDVPGPVAWVTQAYLDEQRRMLPESIYRRMHLNQWCAPEDRLTSAEDLRACATLPGQQEPHDRIKYVIGVDVGVRHDRTVAAVCHAEKQGSGVVVVLDRMEVWAGKRFRPVDLGVVEEWIADTARNYNRARVILDPWQTIAMAERLRHRGLRVDEYAFSQQSIGRLATALHLAIREHRLALPHDDDLLDELANVRLRETSPGVLRLDHDPDKHDDRAIALALATLHLTENAHGQGAAFIEHWRREIDARHGDEAAIAELEELRSRSAERRAAREARAAQRALRRMTPRFTPPSADCVARHSRCRATFAEHRWRNDACIACHARLEQEVPA